MKHRMPLMTRMATALLIVAAVLLVAPTQAAENAKLAELKTSLNLVPEDASFYIGMFRAGEQIEAIGKSRAWAKLVKSPAVQLALKTYEMQQEDPRSPASKVNTMLQDAQIQDVLALLADMFDDEAFLYSDPSLIKSLELLQKLQRYGYFETLRDTKTHQANFAKIRTAETEEEREKAFEQMRKSGKAQQKRFFQFAVQNLDAIKVPTLVFGAKLDDTDRAELNLGKLEFIIGMGMMAVASQQPEMDLSGVLTRKKIDGNNFLVLKLSGKLIPWEEELEIVEMIKEDENAAKVFEKIKNEDLVIAIGVKGDYLLMSIGSSTEAIEKFGKGTGLVTRPEMSRLEPYAGKPITDIAYVSKKLTTLNSFDNDDIKYLLDIANEGVKYAELDEQARDEISADLKKLGGQIENAMPKPGAFASVSYMTPTGGEGYIFSWGTDDSVEKPLELLNHLGGSPILGLVATCPLDVESYDAISQWVNVGWGYFNKYAVPTMSEQEQKDFNEAVELYGPIVAALDKTTREKFLPAFGGEFAIQLDTELTLSTIPGVNQPMPMVEPAIILSVKDADLMDDALESYWKTFGDALAIAGTKCKDMAKVKLPKPATIEDNGNTRYVFSLPKQCPIHEEIKPTVGLGKNTLVFAATPEAALRLMTKTSLTYGGILTDAKKPRISAGYFAWKDLLTSARPWVMFGVEEGIKDMPQGCPLTPDAIRSQARTVLEVLSVVRSITVESYRDGDVTIQHSKIEIKDID